MESKVKGLGIALVFLVLVSTAGFVNAATVYVEFEDATLYPGNSSSFSIWINSTGIPEGIIGLTYQGNNLPSVIQSIDSHNIFSSGTDTSGTYLNGFLNGKSVSNINSLFVGNPVQYGRDGVVFTNDVSSGAFGLDKIVTYNFTLDPNAAPGVYTHNLSLAELSGEALSFNPYRYDNGWLDIPPAGSFEVLSPVTFNPADINQDGSVDIGDLALVGAQWGTDGTGHPLGYSADVAPIGAPDGTVDVGDLAVIGANWGL